MLQIPIRNKCCRDSFRRFASIWVTLLHLSLCHTLLLPAMLLLHSTLSLHDLKLVAIWATAQGFWKFFKHRERMRCKAERRQRRSLQPYLLLVLTGSQTSTRTKSDALNQNTAQSVIFFKTLLGTQEDAEPRQSQEIASCTKNGAGPQSCDQILTTSMSQRSSDCTSSNCEKQISNNLWQLDACKVEIGWNYFKLHMRSALPPASCNIRVILQPVVRASRRRSPTICFAPSMPAQCFAVQAMCRPCQQLKRTTSCCVTQLWLWIVASCVSLLKAELVQSNAEKVMFERPCIAKCCFSCKVA